jgi:Tol biopolymer transport system component
MKGRSLFAIGLSFVLALSLAGAALARPAVTLGPGAPPHPRIPREQLIESLDKTKFQKVGTIQPESITGSTVPGADSWSKIVFESYRDDNAEIYLANGDGSNQTRLTYAGAVDASPRLNRGATRIAFTSNRSGNYDIYTMNLDSSGLAQLTTDKKDDANPAWSPDGTKIAFQAYRDGQAEIYVMNADGSGQTRLTFDAAYDGSPDWSPDGTKIAFTSKRSGGYGIWVMNADGGNPHQVTYQPFSENPSWSPDGTQIAYDADGDNDGWQELWLVNSDGSNARQVYGVSLDQTDTYAGSWSTDGAYLLYTMVTWVYEQNDWYWTWASILSLNLQNLGQISQVISGGVNWFPDLQSIDPTPPSSNVLALPAQSIYKFTVSWSGMDQGLSGLYNYDIQVRDGASGSWGFWQPGIKTTSMDYTGKGGHTYYFRSRARDNAGNLEPWPADYDAFTTVEVLTPRSTLNPTPAYSRGMISLTWSGFDRGGSGIQNYDVQVRDMAVGQWIDRDMGTPGTSTAFDGTPGHTYQFRLRARDNAQNVEPWPSDTNAQTTFFSWKLSGLALDNIGVPVIGAVPTTKPAAFETITSLEDGAYAAYVAQEQATYKASWSKNGYGSLPQTSFDTNGNVTFDVALPPVDNLLKNWGFENGVFTSEDWISGGTVAPLMITSTVHTGKYAVVLGDVPGSASSMPAGRTGISSISQAVSVPPGMPNPTLSFFYLHNGFYQGFQVGISEGIITTIVFTSNDGMMDDWSHQWLDLSDWAGKDITVTLSGNNPDAGGGFTWIYLDEISLGSAHPDLWAQIDSPARTALPGESVSFQADYGNRSSIPANSGVISLTLPSGLTFVSADPPPTSTSPTPVWQVGDLPGGSGPHTITITATVASEVPPFSTPAAGIEIRSASLELETANNVDEKNVLVARLFYLPVALGNSSN